MGKNFDTLQSLILSKDLNSELNYEIYDIYKIFSIPTWLWMKKTRLQKSLPHETTILENFLLISSLRACTWTLFPTRLSNKRKIDGASSKFWACSALYKYLPKQNESNYESDESELHFEDVYWPQNWFGKNLYL